MQPAGLPGGRAAWRIPKTDPPFLCLHKLIVELRRDHLWIAAEGRRPLASDDATLGQVTMCFFGWDDVRKRNRRSMLAFGSQDELDRSDALVRVLTK
jgi:hypothetical protein